MIKRLGIFGGAFDPVHKGHTQSLKYITDLKIIDEIQVIPNYASPHNKDIQTEEKHRLKMLEIAFKEIKNIKLNDIELKNKTVMGNEIDSIIMLKSFELLKIKYYINI